MKTFRMIKVRTQCKDKATQLDGTVTHVWVDMGGSVKYLFQPRGLNPETGQPQSRFPLCAERLTVQESDYEDVDVPFEILGTQVTDRESGFSGMAVEFMRHINGCFHVVVQPAGTLSKTNAPIDRADFDIRSCVGDAIPVLSEGELVESTSREPSPTSGASSQMFAP